MAVEMDKGGVQGVPWGSAHLTCCLESLFGCNRVKGKGTACASCLRDELNPLVKSCSAPFTTEGPTDPSWTRCETRRGEYQIGSFL